MSNGLIHDRGRGPELVGTRITVYNLLVDLLDGSETEAFIARKYGLTAEQVAAARGYILSNPDTVLAQHLRIEERIAAGNPPEVIEAARRTRDEFRRFREWLGERSGHPAEAGEGPDANCFPTFREWLTQQA